MTGSRLVVFGDTLLDTDIDGTVDRHCPDAPVPVVNLDARRLRPGGAGLAALLAARAGHDVVLVSALGTDRPGWALADLLGPHAEVIRMPLRGTTVCKTRIRTGDRSLLRLDSGDGRACGAPSEARLRDVMRDAAAVLVSDYGRGVTADSTIRAALSNLAGQVPVVWDPHPRGAFLVPGCRMVTPNETEAARALPDTGARAAAMLRAHWRCDAVAVTRGARGAVLATADGCFTVPVPGLLIPAGRDTCGAGDAFSAAATGALLASSSLNEAVAEAVGAASRFVADGGAASIGAAAAGELLPGSGPVGGPAACLSAVDAVAHLRHRGGRLVATGGCFDLLHPGHLSLLRQARALGDGLVVCLNSDASVRRRKGPGRPLVRAADRIELLAALEPVDAVAVFDEDTPTTLLETLRPDVWVKGGDYTVSELPEAAVISSYGGEVVIVPVLHGYSTSRLVAVARRQPERP
ncbi:MAG: D-glycero-beta-D-manno-heptose 1-phosphate adenylyltransferase [Pseudonocardiaceae bacterium]